MALSDFVANIRCLISFGTYYGVEYGSEEVQHHSMLKYYAEHLLRIHLASIRHAEFYRGCAVVYQDSCLHVGARRQRC